MKNINKISFKELRNSDKWEDAVIVFTENSFDVAYSELDRSYLISSDNKAFRASSLSNSLFGTCIGDGDERVRLDWYMRFFQEDGWDVDYCYVLK